MYSTILRSSSISPVLDQFRIDILMNRYKNSEKITEVGLANHYGVTRTTIRSVLPVLEAEGLINTMENGTKCVCPMTLADVNNLYDMRRHIEVNAVKAILEAGDFDQSVLLGSLRELVGSTKSNDIRTVLKADGAFHSTVVDLSGNRVFSQVYAAFCGLEVAFFELNMEKSPEYKAQFLAELSGRHSELALSLISNRDKALALFEQHVEDGRVISLHVMQRVLDGDIVKPRIAP